MTEQIWRPVWDVVDEKQYGQLLAKHLPGIVRSDEEHDRIAELLMKLSSSGKNRGGESTAEPLERLLEDYYERQIAGRLEALNPLELLQHLMEEGGPVRLRRFPVCGFRSDGGQTADQR